MANASSVARAGALKALLFSSSAMMGLCAVADAFAQEAPVAEDEVVVTGSRIRGVASTGSNVVALNREEIEDQPVMSTTELLRTVPQNIALGTLEAVGGGGNDASSNPFRSNGINLRGLGGTATLTLLNGYRSVPMGSFGNFVDPSGLPTLALERVEVVADGASAIYGSDAIAGVVNLITRKRFNGAEVMARYGGAKGGYGEYQAGFVVGKSWDDGHITLSYEHQHRDAVFAEDREFITSNQAQFGGRDFRSNQCNPGNIVVGSTFYRLPAGNGVVTPSQLTAGPPNLCDNSRLAMLSPEVDRDSGTISIAYRPTSAIELFLDGYASNRESTSFGIYTANIAIPSSNPFFVSPAPGATSVTVAYNGFPDVGYLETPTGERVTQFVFGARADLPGDWNLEVAGNYGRSKDWSLSRSGAAAANLAAAAASTSPSTALNVFGSGANTNPATWANVFTSLFVIRGNNELRALTAQVDGSVFELPGGAVRLAAGAEYRWEDNASSVQVGTRAAPFPPIGFAAGREVSSVFGELFVPIVGEGNSMPGVESLSVSIAGRYERYSDVGSTTNPKVALIWSPVEDLTLRGTYGESFRAPYLPESTFNSGGYGIYAANNVVDPLSPTGFSSGISLAGGNTDLKPSTATTWAFGGDWTPGAVPGLRLSATYFNIDYQDQIFALQGNPTVLQNPAYAPYVTRNPTPAQIAAYLNFGGSPVPLNAPLPPTISFLLDARRQNLGQTLMDGVDFDGSYSWENSLGGFSASLALTYVANVEQSVAPGAAKTNVLNTINNPVRWRGRAGLNWTGGPWSANAFVSYVNAYTNNLAGAAPFTVDALATVDAQIAREMNFFGDSTTEIALTVNNLFDTDPPHSNTALGYDPNNASALGRLVSISLRQAF